MDRYLLKRSRRKTCAIYILPDGQVEVRAPLGLPRGTIDRWVSSRAGWIEEKQRAQRQRQAARRGWDPLEQGLLFLGQTFPARVEEERRDAAFDGGEFLLPAGDWREQRPLVEALYCRLAREKLLPRLAEWSRATGLTPKKTGVTRAATRWGSCSGRDSVNLSWRLVTAPAEAVDYVCVHELAHLRHHNHSPAFWQLVEEILPDWRRREALLRQTGRQLAAQNWKEGWDEDSH